MLIDIIGQAPLWLVSIIPNPNLTKRTKTMLPKIKSDLDHLEQLASDFHSDGHAQTAIDLRRAIQDIKNLRDALTEEWN